MCVRVLGSYGVISLQCVNHYSESGFLLPARRTPFLNFQQMSRIVFRQSRLQSMRWKSKGVGWGIKLGQLLEFRNLLSPKRTLPALSPTVNAHLRVEKKTHTQYKYINISLVTQYISNIPSLTAAMQIWPLNHAFCSDHISFGKRYKIHGLHIWECVVFFGGFLRCYLLFTPRAQRELGNPLYSAALLKCPDAQLSVPTGHGLGT